MASLDLPFVVAPAKRKTQRLGTKATGILELEVHGSILVGEAIDIAELMADKEQAIVSAAKLAERISAEQSISLLEAYSVVEGAAVGRALSDPQLEIKARYLEEISAMARAYIAQGQRRMQASVTALIRHRLDRPAWSMDDTARLDQPLLEELYAFFERERSGGEEETAAPPSEQEIKKQRPGTGKQAA